MSTFSGYKFPQGKHLFPKRKKKNQKTKKLLLEKFHTNASSKLL